MERKEKLERAIKLVEDIIFFSCMDHCWEKYQELRQILLDLAPLTRQEQEDFENSAHYYWCREERYNIEVTKR